MRIYPLLIGNGNLQDINVLFSDTNNFRNEDFVTNQGLSYFKGTTVGAVANQYSHVQVDNPAGSGVVGLIDGFILSSTTSGIVSIMLSGALLGSFVGAMESLKIGAGTGDLDVYKENNVAKLGTTIGNISLLANRPELIFLKFPFELPADQRMSIVHNTVNIDLTVNWLARQV